MNAKIISIIIITFIAVSSDILICQVQQQWIQKYNGPSGFDDRVTAMTADKAGNTYITGHITNGNSNDFATIKYNSSGVRLWVATYSGVADGNDVPTCIATDDSGNVFVSGVSETLSFGTDFRTIKYNSSGQQQWIATYSGSAGYNDSPTGIFVDRSGYIYVTGYSYEFGRNYDYITIKYNPSGSFNWSRTFNGPGNSIDKASSIMVDNSGNVYVTGYTTVSWLEVDYATIKYDAFGNQQWVIRYDGPLNGDDFATSIDVDQSGNVFVTGESRGIETCTDYATIKYNSSGSQIWLIRYNDQDSGCERPVSLKIDGEGNVIVTGSSYSKNSVSGDFLTLKYTNSGSVIWEKRYNSPGNYDDITTGMIVDSLYNVYITGYNEMSSFSTYSITTIKYSSSGDQLWEQIFHSEASIHSSDQSIGISLDSLNNVYIAGYSYNTGTNDDFFTIKYSKNVSITQNSNLVPETFSLSQNYPNPFNPGTVIRYSLIENGLVTLKVYDVLGNEIATLINENQSHGNYNYQFSTVNYQLSSGIYFYKLTAGTFSETKRMILLK